MKTCKHCGYGVMKDPLGIDDDSWIHSRSYFKLCDVSKPRTSQEATPV